jgi:hypothetical protein
MKLTPMLFLLFAPCAFADEHVLPDAPVPKPEAIQPVRPVRTARNEYRFNKKVFWAGVGALAASTTYDMFSTQDALNRGRSENSPLFGRHPSEKRLALTSAGILAAEVVLFHVTEHRKNRWVRWFGRGYVTYAVTTHITDATCNYTADQRKNCHAL